jgi:hypothetical protein
MSRKLHEAEKACRSLGRTIKEILPANLGFLVILFDKTNSKDGFFTYLSDCERGSMVNLLRETASKIEGQEQS